VGEYMDGKWWGGYYGWHWPHGLFNQLESTIIGAANAYMVTGDSRYLELPRSVLKLVQSQGRKVNGQVLVPNRYGSQGWYDYRPIQASYPIYLWYISQETQDYERLMELCNSEDWSQLQYHKAKGDWGHEGPWLRFIQGRNPDYPAQILKAGYAESLRRLQVIRADTSVPDEQDVHHWQERNPVVLEGLVQTMLGGPNHIYHGGLLHCRVRYFDPVRRLPGVPPDVAALVDGMTPDSVSVQLVNLHSSEPREVIVQAGAFGEHQFTRVQGGGKEANVDCKFFRVWLEPGAAGRLTAGMKRYVNPPTYAFPWQESDVGRVGRK
jgi:hypothetical protein